MGHVDLATARFGFGHCFRVGRAVLLGMVAVAVLLPSRPAQAACTPAAAANTPASGTTVTCSGVTTNQNSPNGYGDGTQNGLTINVQSGATVTSNQLNGATISVNNGNTVNNAGTVTSTGGGNIGTNGGIIAAGTLTVNNTGTISVTAGGQGIAASDLTLTNSSTGTITTDLISVGAFTYNINNAGTISSSSNLGNGVITGGNSGTTSVLTNSGTIQNTGTGFVVTLTGTGQTYNVNNSGNILGNSTVFATNGSVSSGGNIINITNSATISSASSLAISTASVSGFNFPNTYNITNAATGTISGPGASAIRANSIGFAAGTGDVINLTNLGTVTGNIAVQTIGSGAIASVFNAGTITGTGGTAISFSSPGNTLTIAPTSVINGNVIGSGTDIFQLGGTGTGTFDVSLLGTGAQYSGFTTFNKLAGSNWTVSGSSTFAGATNVNGGILSVNGSLANSTVTVNAGGTLGGNGIVGNTIINGGTLAPGNSIGLLTVQGNLVFTAAANYMVEVSPSNADRTNVTGTATLGGATVNAAFAAGTYVARQYTIVNATGGVSGAFNGPVNTNLPSGFQSSLSYDGNNAYLNLALFTGPAASSGLNINQQNVANALSSFFNRTGGIPMVFGALSPAGLTQASGELPTASQQTTFDAMNLFMGLLTDPFVAGRGNGLSSMPGTASTFAEEGDASRYASTGRKRNGSERDAYGMITKAVPREVLDPRWSVWAAGFGGSQTTDGNAVLGSNAATSRIYGTAAGADYLLSPRTLLGFALAGGGTNFSLANGLGSGRSDLFQAGAFVRHTAGNAYVSGALAYGWQDITTDRTVTIAGVDQLRARFNANAWSGRVEGGYRFVTPWMGWGITPYAAGQFTTFSLPAYAEQVLSGANTFALAYGAKDVTASRSELGLRSDKSFAMQDAVLTLRGRLAWAHNFDTDRSIGATFQTLPGASFVVNGARQASDAALTTASAEWKWRNGWSAAATFEGEFSSVTTSYAGKGVVRYAW